MNNIQFNNIYNSINYHNCGILQKFKIKNDLSGLNYIYNYRTKYWIYYINLNHKDFMNKYCLFGKFMFYTQYPDKSEYIKFYKECIKTGLCPMIKYTNPNLGSNTKTICIYTDNNHINILKLSEFLLSQNIFKYSDLPFRANWKINNCINYENGNIFNIEREMMLSDFRGF